MAVQFQLSAFELRVPDVVTPTPSMSLGSSSLQFSATVSSSNPADQFFTVDNVASGTLNWTATSSQAWLTESPISGTAPSTVTASINITGLVSGTYSGTLTITCPTASNSPQLCSVTLSLAAAPIPPAPPAPPSQPGVAITFPDAPLTLPSGLPVGVTPAGVVPPVLSRTVVRVENFVDLTQVPDDIAFVLDERFREHALQTLLDRSVVGSVGVVTRDGANALPVDLSAPTPVYVTALMKSRQYTAEAVTKTVDRSFTELT